MNICRSLYNPLQCLISLRARGFSAENSNKYQVVLEKLKDRELIRIKGAEAIPFLQGLVTNDMSKLQTPSGPDSIYAMFLNNGGRILYDTIIYRTSNPEVFVIECDKAISSELRRHLRMYRVRRKIDVDAIDDEYTPWVAFSNTQPLDLTSRTQSEDLFVVNDPRLNNLGTRVLAPTEFSFVQLLRSFWRNNEVPATAANEECNYRSLRYSEGVAEGVAELPPGKCFPLEANGDYLNGVNFNKGCYIGQELTARVYHSGVVRKRYMPLRVTATLPNPPLPVQSVAGANLGTVFGQQGNRALALLRVEQALNAQQHLVIDGDPCYAEKPKWWPSNNSHEKRSIERE